MTKYDYDLFTIGAGSGGLSVAAGAVQMGAKVVLLEGSTPDPDSAMGFASIPRRISSLKS